MSKKNCVIDHITTPHKITLYKNGNNTNIYYYFSWKSKTYQGSTSTDNIEISRDKAIEIFFEIKKGLRKKGHQKIIKFQDILSKFLKYKEEQGVAIRTLKDYKRQSKYLIERYKDRDIKSLCTKSEFMDYREWRKKYYSTHDTKKIQKYKRYGKIVEGRKYKSVGNVVLNRECRLLVSILRFGKEYMNVFQGIEIPRYKMLPEKRREDILTKDEYQKLKEYWLKKNPYYWQIISFVNNTGIRYPSELNRICYKDVHLDKSYILIRDRKNKNKSEPVNTPVPIVGRAKEIIEELISRENIANKPDDPFFVNDKGKQIISISKQFKNSLVECGINKNLTMYSLRHLFTTRMVRRPDIPIKVLSDVLGHKNSDMISKYYSHLRAQDYVNVFQQSEDHRQEIIKMQKQRK